MKKLGTNSVTEVAKEAGQQWNKLSAAKKKPYEAAPGRGVEDGATKWRGFTMNIWGFPEIGGARSSSILMGGFLGTPIYGNPSMDNYGHISEYKK